MLFDQYICAYGWEKRIKCQCHIYVFFPYSVGCLNMLLPVQSKRQKHQKNVLDLFKVTNKYTRPRPMTFF